MTEKDYFNSMGVNYSELLHRFSNDGRIMKFLGMMLTDNSFPMLKSAIEQKNQEAAFRAAHTLKGVALNLGLSHLSNSASELTEVLRSSCLDTEKSNLLFEQVSKDYDNVISCIKMLLQSKDY